MKSIVIDTTHKYIIYAEVSDGFDAKNAVKEGIITDAKNCRLAMRYDRGGIFGLAEHGPDSECRISDTADLPAINGVTMIMSCTDAAVSAWKSIKTHRR